MKMPNGHILPDFITWGDFGRKDTPLSASWLFEVPCFKYDTNNVANSVHDKTNNILKTAYAFGEKSSVQYQWTVSSDFAREQLQFDADTEKYASNPVTKFFRNQRSERNWERMKNGTLRREKTIISLNVPCGVTIPNHLSDSEMRYAFLSLYRSKKQLFDNFGAKVRSFFYGDAYRIKRLYAADMKAELDSFLNASRRYRNPKYNPFANNKWQQLSIQDNVVNSGFVGNKCKATENNFGFFWDNNYHEIMVLKNYPESTNPGAFYALTSLDMIDYSVTVNLHPTDSKKEKKQIEDLMKRLVNESEGNKNYGHKESIKNLQSRLDELNNGTAVPFHADYIIRVWDKNKNNLQAKISVITSAIETMGGAGFQQISLPTSAKSLFYSSWTGASHIKYGNYRLPVLNKFICDMLPLGSTYVGNLDGAMALYDGDNKNICGIKTFIEGTPQNSFYLGVPGCGKSLLINDELAQTECFYRYICLIEEGNSYGPWIKAIGGESIIINPNSNFTINVFDTEGLPITNMTISSAAGLLAKMCGDIDDMVKARLWRAMLTHYIHILYDHAYQEWNRSNISLQPEIARRGIAVHKYWEKHLEDEDYLVAWAEFRDLLENKDPEAEEMLQSVSDKEITAYIQKSSRELRDISYAWFEPKDFPTLGQLVTILKNNIDKRIHKEETVKEVATLLNQWTARKGDAGVLFDGHTTKKITSRIVHFELGKIGEAAEQLKSVVLFLINNTVRNHIITLPRSSWKLMVFEEFARMVGMKDQLGAKLAGESYAQMRKFNCCVKAVVQQYGQFKRNPIREVVTGTSKQFYFLSQHDRTDLQDLATDINIPDRLQNVITEYASPEHLQEGVEKYSSFTYYQRSSPNPVFGTCRNYASDEILYLTSTKGVDVEEREKGLKRKDLKHLNYMEKIIELVRERNEKQNQEVME